MKPQKNILLPILLLTVVLSSCGSLQLNRHRYTGGMHISFNRNKNESIGLATKKSKVRTPTHKQDTQYSVTNAAQIPLTNNLDKSLKEDAQANPTVKENHQHTSVAGTTKQEISVKFQKNTSTKFHKSTQVAQTKNYLKDDDEDLSLLARIGKVFLFVLLISTALTAILMLSGLSFGSAISLVGFYWLCLIVYGAITLLVIFLCYLWLKSLFS